MEKKIHDIVKMLTIEVRQVPAMDIYELNFYRPASRVFLGSIKIDGLTMEVLSKKSHDREDFKKKGLPRERKWQDMYEKPDRKKKLLVDEADRKEGWD